ncbi:hypothetical protein CRG98_026511 [Punica granatum]|uniref:Uncharacterized protein n=1 Tax=Punica granatum TaxID=22663 RepID=A0A2I0JBS8_PUNGR|nr:hypothetical protein CRG98_026511 [Punica granatum]
MARVGLLGGVPVQPGNCGASDRKKKTKIERRKRVVRTGALTSHGDFRAEGVRRAEGKQDELPAFLVCEMRECGRES